MLRRFRTSLALVSSAVAACTPPPFDSHTVSAFGTTAEYEQLSNAEHGRAEMKFAITAFSSRPAIAYYDSKFYALHDEWFWFHLLNGQRVPGVDAEPARGLHFSTIAEVYSWARGQSRLPLGLQWVDGGRLYAPLFYELALDRRPRSIGVGTLLHVTAKGPRPERWGFQLEFVDVIEHAELVTFFEAIDATVPKELAGNVFWVVRSPKQEELAQRMEQGLLRFHDRILRQKDLTVPGETEVYSAGLTAGRLRRIASGESVDDAQPSDLLILQDVPDALPPAAGVVTAVAQTPLAHFNLLARNRGIPNAYRGGVFDDAELETLSYYRAPVVLSAVGPDQLVVKQITERQLTTWQALLAKPAVAVKAVDTAALPYSYDLNALSYEDVDALRPAFGGKAAGYLGLLAGAPETTPDAVMAISIRAYAEHLAPLRPSIEAMLADSTFAADVRARVLLLEGLEAFDARYASAKDASFKRDFLSSHPAGTPLGDLAREGGLKAEVRRRPIGVAAYVAISQALIWKFLHYAPVQGLRFRSSSTAEDIEGFNGAGLYDSNTGYLTPAAAIDPSDRDHGVEWALKKTWASYWSIEAFEERRLENVDHLSGNMAVVVHANFPDEAEKSNGVLVFTLRPGSTVMELNVQAGALSVTNPTSTALPEIDRVTVDASSSTPRIERLRASTVVPGGAQLLDDAALLWTFERAKAVALRWQAQRNAALPVAQQGRTLVLDFEFREVHAGWPQLKSGVVEPSRLVLKQARTLEPGFRTVANEVRALPLPRDIFVRARRIERRTCQAEAFTATVVEAYTDPLLSPDLGHGVEPFTASVTLQLKRDVPELGRPAGSSVTLEHPRLASVTHPGLSGGVWGLDVVPNAKAMALEHFAGLRLNADGTFVLTGDAGGLTGAGLTCSVDVLHTTPNEYLLSLLEQ